MKKKAHKPTPRKRASKKTEKPNAATSAALSVLGVVAEKVGKVFSTTTDIVGSIKLDHDDLRNFIDQLKDTSLDMSERRRAYEQFSALLKSHTEAEEKAVYQVAIGMTGREMHIKIAEGFVEHRVADELMSRIEAARDPLEWSAHANVLAEVVEHHLKEEERDLLPLIRKTATVEQNMDMLAQYLDIRGRTQLKVTKDNEGVLHTLQ